MHIPTICFIVCDFSALCVKRLHYNEGKYEFFFSIHGLLNFHRCIDRYISLLSQYGKYMRLNKQTTAHSISSVNSHTLLKYE